MTEISPIVTRIAEMKDGLPDDRTALAEAAQAASFNVMAVLQAGDVTATPYAIAWIMALVSISQKITAPEPETAPSKPQLRLVK